MEEVSISTKFKILKDYGRTNSIDYAKIMNSGYNQIFERDQYEKLDTSTLKKFINHHSLEILQHMSKKSVENKKRVVEKIEMSKSFSEIEYYEILKIYNSIKEKSTTSEKIKNLLPDAVLAIYDGYSFFSIFKG